LGNLKESDRLDDLSLDGQILLILNLKQIEWDGAEWVMDSGLGLVPTYNERDNIFSGFMKCGKFCD